MRELILAAVVLGLEGAYLFHLWRRSKKEEKAGCATDNPVYDRIDYRVWPDGATQECCEEPYHWRSDDFIVVAAKDEEEALLLSGVMSPFTPVEGRC